MIEKFESSHIFLYVTVATAVIIPVLGYSERGYALLSDLPIIITLYILMIVAVKWNEKTTYLLLNQTHFINSGYRSFGKDTVKLSRIKYITRIPQTALPFVGPSLMLIYSTRDDGVIAHAAVREYSFDEPVLKQFLTRIKELNPSIELDTEYQEFLNDQRVLRTKTNNTVQTVEHMLRAKGERW